MDKRQRLAIREPISQRTPRPLMAPMLAFDLPEEAAALHREPIFGERRHNARTLVKHSEFRLVLLALAPGARIEEQSIDERTAIQTLRGGLSLQVPGGIVELEAGGLVALDRGTPFCVEAREATDVLLWVGWSRD
jgi:quercetin dioxygenase-like cupin family protein